jgi:carboxylate-amine ligase
LADAARILETGASYQRQRDVARRHGGDLTAVVDSLIAEMAEDRPRVADLSAPQVRDVDPASAPDATADPVRPELGQDVG